MALNALLTRRTIRQYAPDYIIPEVELHAICEAAKLSPTGHNIQDIDLVCVSDRKKVEEVTKITFATLDKEGQKAYLKRIKKFGVKNPISGDAGVLVCLVKNERAKEPQRTLVHEGIIEMGLLIAAREFGYQGMVLGCMKQGDKAAMEKVLGIEPGKLIIGVVLGKPADKVLFHPKKIFSKVTYLK